MHRDEIISEAERREALALRDLTDPSQGVHAMQEVVARIERRLADCWDAPVILHRGTREVSVVDNYDKLRYPAEAIARGARYTRYVGADRVLRTQMSAVIPGLLRKLARYAPRDAILLCPGIVYRRDAIDRLHTGEPHQLDVWRVCKGRLRRSALRELVERVIETTLPASNWRSVPAEHPYTTHGTQIEVERNGHWIEVGECGMAHPAVLEDAGIDPGRYSGLAMGLGLDRLLMLIKRVEDIRVLRSSDPRIVGQMLDLSPYRPVSSRPPARRDLSVAVRADTSPEEIGARVREGLGEDAVHLEAVQVLAETSYSELPATARERLGMRPGQKNVLLRLVVRHLSRTLTSDEANELRDRVYRAVHEGRLESWAIPRNPRGSRRE